MTTAAEATARNVAERTVQLRIGTVYERTIKVQFAPIDVAIASNGVVYVLIRSNETRRNSPRTYYEVIPPGGEGGEADLGGPALVPSLDGERLRSLRPAFADAGDVCCCPGTTRSSTAPMSTRTSSWRRAPPTGARPPGARRETLRAASTPLPASPWTRTTAYGWLNGRSHSVQRFTRDGRYLSGFGEFGSEPGQLRYPWGLAWDPFDRTLVVSDWGNNRVQRFGEDGQLLQVIGPSLQSLDGPLSGPCGVSLDQYGDIYITDRYNDRVVMVNSRGVFVETFIGDALFPAPAIQRLMGFPDLLRRRDNVVGIQQERRLFRPTSTRVDREDRVYIADTQRQRVQVYHKIVRPLSPDEVAPPEGLEDPIVFM